MAQYPNPCSKCLTSGRGRDYSHLRDACPYAVGGKAKVEPRVASAAWQPAVAASQEREVERRPSKTAAKAREETRGAAPGESLHARARADATAAYGQGHHSTLMWIDMRCQMAKMHPMDPWWVGYFRDFYASGKMTGAGRGGLRAGKSDSIPRALVNDAIFSMRELDPATVGVIPIMSRDRTEATDRFTTIRQILRALGVEAKGKDDLEDPALPGGIGGEYQSATLPSGGGVIKMLDSQGHKIEFRIYPARISGAIGFTGIGGFCDEVDLWPFEKDVDERTGRGKLTNPAGKVIELLEKRFTTQPEARLYVWSASYDVHSAHADIIARGDTMIRHVARLGELGAQRDAAERMRLAQYIAAKGLPVDPRLIEAADLLSPDIPSWVTNPTKADILRCYALSNELLAPMLGLYGGRAAEHGPGGLTDDDFIPHGEPSRYDGFDERRW